MSPPEEEAVALPLAHAHTSRNPLASGAPTPPPIARRPGQTRPGRSIRNERKWHILRILTTFYARPMSPKEITLVYWDGLGEDGRKEKVFDVEWARFREACRRLASRDYYPGSGPYLRKYETSGREVRYKLTRKGERVRRKIARGTLPGRPAGEWA